MFFITISGLNTPMLAIPIPALAVPYAPPKSSYDNIKNILANTIAAVMPMKPKNGALGGHNEASNRRDHMLLMKDYFLAIGLIKYDYSS